MPAFFSSRRISSHSASITAEMKCFLAYFSCQKVTPAATATSVMKKGASRSAAEDERPLAYDEVKVLKQEAVGMYEVATLAAGDGDHRRRAAWDRVSKWNHGRSHLFIFVQEQVEIIIP